MLDNLFKLNKDELENYYSELSRADWRLKAVIKGLWLNITGNDQVSLFNQMENENEKISKV